MWSIAVYDLRLTTDQFLQLQPRQLDALLKRRERELQTTEFLFGQLASMVVNFSMAAPKKPTAPRDFMPSEWAKTTQIESKPKRRSRQAIADEIRGVMANWLKKDCNG